ncbi:hypothetical protein AAHH80_37225, partial [Burkholderia pseudomallei]
ADDGGSVVAHVGRVLSVVGGGALFFPAFVDVGGVVVVRVTGGLVVGDVFVVGVFLVWFFYLIV